MASVADSIFARELLELRLSGALLATFRAFSEEAITALLSGGTTARDAFLRSVVLSAVPDQAQDVAASALENFQVVEDVLDVLADVRDYAAQTGMGEQATRALMRKAVRADRGLFVPTPATIQTQVRTPVLVPATGGPHLPEHPTLLAEDVPFAEYGQTYETRLERSARTVATTVHGRLARIEAELTGQDLRWVTMGDHRVRSSHRAAQGQTVSYDTWFQVGGIPMEYPGDPAAPEDETINCRCVLTLVKPADRRVQTYIPRAWLTAAAPNQARAPRGTPIGGEWIDTPRGMLADLVREQGGASLDPVTLTQPTDGYMVAVQGHNREVPEGEFFRNGEDELYDWMEANRDALSEDGAHIGLWHDTENGEVVFDVSQRIADRGEAIEAGRDRNQQAIWDVANGEEIDTGGTGDRQANPDKLSHDRGDTDDRPQHDDTAARAGGRGGPGWLLRLAGGPQAGVHPPGRRPGPATRVAYAAPNQARAPKGTPIGGEWIDTPGGLLTDLRPVDAGRAGPLEAGSPEAAQALADYDEYVDGLTDEQRRMEPPIGASSALYHAYKYTGYDQNQPTPVDVIGETPDTMYRGVEPGFGYDANGRGYDIPAAGITDQFRDGEHWAGTGIHGDGSYFARNSGDPMKAWTVANNYAGESDGAVIKARWKPDARVLTFPTDYDRQEWDRLNIDASGGASGAMNTGVAAALLGYDGIRIGQGGDSWYEVILNRGAVDVEAQDTAVREDWF